MVACIFPLALPAADAWYWTGNVGDANWCMSLNWVGGTVPNSTDTAIFREHGSIYTNVILTCNASVARVRMSGNAVTPRIVKIGPAETSDRTLTINGAAEALANESAGTGIDLTFSGEVNANGRRLTLRNNTSQPWNVIATTSSLLVTCDVSGSDGVFKTGVGTLLLAGNNSFGGDNIITAGRVIIGHPNALGFGGFNPTGHMPSTVVSNIATLDLGGQTNVNEVLSLNGVGLGQLGGALVNSSNTTSTIVAGRVTSISVTNGGIGYSYPVSVTISGGGGSGATATAELGLSAASFTLVSGGIGYMSPPRVYLFGGGGSGAQVVATIDTNTTEVTGLVVTAPGSGYSSAPLVVLNGGDGVEAEAVANATNFTVVGTTLLTSGSGYTSPPTVSFSGGGTAAAAANLGAVILPSAATIGGSGSITIEPVISGSGVLTKKGTGYLTLLADNTYTAGTVVSEGTLLANNTNGSATGPGDVTVNSGGTLAGTGIIGGLVIVNPGGLVSGGNGPGILRLTGGLNLSGGGANLWDLAAFKDDSNGLAGVDFDQLAVQGGVLDLSGNSQLQLNFPGGLVPNSTVPFWQTNHAWTILTVAPPGTNAANLPFSNIVNGQYSAGSFSNYVGTGGNIMLTYTANPLSEPEIFNQPQNVATNWGRTAAFNVTAIGADPLAYQWYFQNEGGLIAGATNSYYLKTNVQPEQAGNYFVIVTNTLGSATSDVAVLTVIVTPETTVQSPRFVGVGTTNVVLSWSSVVGGTYQLQYNTNLNTTNWFVVSNVVAISNSVTVSHRRLVRDPHRYYRVIGK